MNPLIILWSELRKDCPAVIKPSVMRYDLVTLGFKSNLPIKFSSRYPLNLRRLEKAIKRINADQSVAFGKYSLKLTAPELSDTKHVSGDIIK